MKDTKRRIVAALGALTIMLTGCTSDSLSLKDNNQEATIESLINDENDDNLFLKKLRNNYKSFTGKEDYTVLNATYEDICNLYKQAYILIYNYINNISQSEEDNILAKQLIEILDNTENPVLAICNIHNLYVLEFFYIYPTENEYYEFFGELTKYCANVEDSDDVYIKYTNLASLLHLKACEENHTDQSLNTNNGYKYMYECDKYEYGPSFSVTTKLVLK